MVFEYLNVFIYLLISFLLSVVILLLSIFVVYRVTDIEKVSAYECGFHPFQDARGKFEVRFYLVAILFIIFDLEIMFLFPWSLVYNFLNFLGYFSMLIFLIVLTFGFLYEWKKGALDWE